MISFDFIYELPAEVSRNSWVDVEAEVEKSMLSYLEDLDQELTSQRDLRSRHAAQSLKRLQPAQQILSVVISTTGINEVLGTSWKRP